MTQTAPKSVKAHVNLGFEYFTRRDFESAKEQYEEARTIYEPYPGVYDLGAVIAYEEKDFVKVQELLEKSLSVNPINTLMAADYNFMYLARAYFIQGYYEEALIALETVFEVNEGHPIVQDRILYAVTLTKLGRYEESIAAVRRYLANDMFYPEVKIVMAVNYWRLGQEEEARKYFDFVKDRTDEEKIELINKF